jgi:hypothetical protein
MSLLAASLREPGPARADRPKILERLRQELAALETAEEQIVDEMASAGLNVEHRSEVVARRVAEASRQRSTQQAVADRTAREAKIDSKFKTTVREETVPRKFARYTTAPYLTATKEDEF